MSRWADEVKARGVADVAAVLGLDVRAGRSLGPCPASACQALRRGSSDPRGPLGLTADGLGWRCHRCQASGDAVTLAALRLAGTVPGKGDTTGWRAVAAFCEAHGLCTPSPDAAPRLAPPRSSRPPAAPPPAPIVAPQRPPVAEVRDLWARGLSVTDDADVCAWLLEGKKRRIDPGRVAERDLARALPLAGPLPAWCASWRRSSHRVIVPLYGPGGHLESVHARAVVPTPKKALSPTGYAVRGCVLADALGRQLLEGAAPPPGVSRVIVAEGVPNYLWWATFYGDAAEDAPAVLGVIAGSWTAEIAATIPTRWTVIIRTDLDDAGEKYAETIRASVAGRCDVKRLRSRVSK